MRKSTQIVWPYVATGIAIAVTLVASVVAAKRLLPDSSRTASIDTTVRAVELIPTQIVCGQEIAAVIDVETDHGRNNVPSFVYGTSWSGEATGSALACSDLTGMQVVPERITAATAAVSVSLPAPTITHSWLTFEEVPTRDSAGAVDRALAGFDCLFGDCSAMDGNVANWFDHALRAVHQAAMESEAVDAAEVEITEFFRGAFSGYDVTVEYTGTEAVQS